MYFTQARPKHELKVRNLINKHFAYLEKGKGAVNDASELDENMQAFMGDRDYSPAVLFAVNPIYE
jgi:hypothetical protein